MSNPIQDRFTTNFEKAKSTGKPRIDRIREIFKDAATQAMAEVKEGSGEVKEIAKDTFSAISEDVNETRERFQDGSQPTSDTNSSACLQTLLLSVFSVVKQNFDKAVVWYKNTQAQAKASEPVNSYAWEQKKAEVEDKVGEAGAVLAQKEHQVRQQLKDLLQTAASKL
ncbi:MAG TPA: hypothetical protein V6C84_11750 [Coleofasciculaceae cyanobacterium]|jgi:hypothetical protein